MPPGPRQGSPNEGVDSCEGTHPQPQLNDEIERLAGAPTTNKIRLSQSSTPSGAHRICQPRDRSSRLFENAARSTQAQNGTATTSLIWSVTKKTGWLLQIIGQIVGASEGAIAAAVASEAAMSANNTALFRAMITAAVEMGRAAKRTAAVCNVTSHKAAPTCLLGNTSNHQRGQCCADIQPII